MARGTDGRVGSAVGMILALGVPVVATVFVLYARLAAPRTASEPGFVPVERWPWWPGSASIDQTLLVFVAALLLVGVAAFVRRPRSGIAR